MPPFFNYRLKLVPIKFDHNPDPTLTPLPCIGVVVKRGHFGVVGCDSGEPFASYRHKSFLLFFHRQLRDTFRGGDEGVLGDCRSRGRGRYV